MEFKCENEIKFGKIERSSSEKRKENNKKETLFNRLLPSFLELKTLNLTGENQKLENGFSFIEENKNSEVNSILKNPSKGSLSSGFNLTNCIQSSVHNSNIKNKFSSTSSFTRFPLILKENQNVLSNINNVET